MKTLTEKKFFEWHEDDKSVTLREKSGSYGGGSEVIVISEGNGFADGKHASRELQRSGCVQRYVGGNE